MKLTFWFSPMSGSRPVRLALATCHKYRIELEVASQYWALCASTSISAALGFAAARDQKGDNNRVVAVIGDGSMSAGMAYEAMNNAAEATSGQLMVILNDNDMSIAPPVGGIDRKSTRLNSSH